ncbi:hypothetical protein FA13DRAFT_1790728 [Coprinellus micaceus]|uniref:Protein kinase domain-containing protein n=1 Tax=Coprinellus micaceus TaxID=71717 RepID=A0A4Y7TE19_COPMI|nr:hypothetical protein FA13DRAFT_1790728 [Coprinellus micaceus]
MPSLQGADPRNHTLPVLEYLTLDDFVFAVLPRWHCAFECETDAIPFKSASEILHMAETFYEGLQFLHENRISHGDISEGNIMTNVLLGRANYGVPDMRDSGLSMDFLKAPATPSKDDVRCLTNVLQRWVRVLESNIPELGVFFDEILTSDDNHLPSAQDCLCTLRQIRSGLTPSELAQPPKFVFWCGGGSGSDIKPADGDY